MGRKVLLDHRRFSSTALHAFSDEGRRNARDRYGIPHVIHQAFPVVTHPDQAVRRVVHRVGDREIEHGRVADRARHIPGGESHLRPLLGHLELLGGNEMLVPFPFRRQAVHLHPGGRGDLYRIGGGKGVFVFSYHLHFEGGLGLGSLIIGEYQGVAQQAVIEMALGRGAGQSHLEGYRGILSGQQIVGENVGGLVFRDRALGQIGAPSRDGRRSDRLLAGHFHPDFLGLIPGLLGGGLVCRHLGAHFLALLIVPVAVLGQLGGHFGIFFFGGGQLGIGFGQLGFHFFGRHVLFTSIRSVGYRARHIPGRKGHFDFQ